MRCSKKVIQFERGTVIHKEETRKKDLLWIVDEISSSGSKNKHKISYIYFSKHLNSTGTKKTESRHDSTTHLENSISFIKRNYTVCKTKIIIL